MSQKIELSFSYEKETPGTYRFQEKGVPKGERGAVGTLYVTKPTFKNGAPKELKVSIEVVK